MAYIPNSIKAGLTFEIEISLPDYDPSLWALDLVARGPVAINLTAVGSDDVFTLSETAQNTSSWPQGLYQYSLRVSKDSQVFEVDFGSFQVDQNIADLTNDHDARSFQEKTIETIEAVLSKTATLEQQQYTINGRTLIRRSTSELLQLRDKLRLELIYKKNRKGLGRSVSFRCE